MTKKRLSISGMHCTSCSMLIEGELMDIGVEATANYTKGYVYVVYDTKKHSEKEIAGVITQLGYTVKSVS